LRNNDPACFTCVPASGPNQGDNMTIARIVAITAVVCAAMGATTQADAAKRKPAGYIELNGCAYWVPLACTVMGSGNDTYALYGSATAVPLLTPIKVLGRRTGNVGYCWGTQVQVVSWKPNPKTSCMWR
jgi:hypothetical protein